jgi:hypothetical protein
MKGRETHNSTAKSANGQPGANPNKNRQTKSVVVGVVAILSAGKVSAISVRISVGQF